MFNYQEVSVPFNYRIAAVDTETDTVVVTVRSRTISGIEDTLNNNTKVQDLGVFRNYTYDPTGRYVLYVTDNTFGTPEGQARLQELYNEHPANVIPEILEDYGLDMDIWFELYLTDELRQAFCDGHKKRSRERQAAMRQARRAPDC